MGQRRMTEHDYNAIKGKLRAGEKTTAIAIQLGRGQSTVSQVKNSKNWIDYRHKNWKRYNPTTVEKFRIKLGI